MVTSSITMSFSLVDTSFKIDSGSKFKKSAYGTISYLPAAFGLTCASVVIRELSGWKPIKTG